MELRSLIIYICGLIARLAFLARHRDRPDIFVLAPILMDLQDGRIHLEDAEAAIAPYGTHIGDYLQHLGRKREAVSAPPRGTIRLPRGCRLSLLHFSPLLQILRIIATRTSQDDVQGYDFPMLPSNEDGIMTHLEASCGWLDDIDAAVALRFGHTLAEYAAYLVGLRKKDPVLFVLLMAREFPLAADYLAKRQCADGRLWLLRAARIAEVQRLAEMMSYSRGRKKIMSSRLRKALDAMVYRKRPSQRKAALKQYRDCLPVIRRLGISIEAVRALLLGDAASASLVSSGNHSPLNWDSIPKALKRLAVSRAELFSMDRSRHCWTRRDMPMDMYYGVPLEQLACVAILELTRGGAGSEGSDECAVIAAAMCQNLMGKKLTLERVSRRASMITQVYLRRVDKLGAGGRFDPRLQFDPFADAALYVGCNALAMGGSMANCRSSVRAFIDVAARVLANRLAVQRGLIDPRLAAQVAAVVASSLTPPTMDPIFASLLDRRMSELGIRPLHRSDRWDHKHGRPQLTARLRKTFRAVRASFARFQDLGKRHNHPDAEIIGPPRPHRPLSVQTAPPMLRKMSPVRRPIRQ